MKRISLVLLFLWSASVPLFADEEKIRVGHFPNVTHAPALIARAAQHFESRLGPGIAIEWKTFNAGPEAIEALFAGAIDLLYVGPNPAVNGYVRSQGDALRIVAGVASGGAGFVVREDSGIEHFEDIQGKRIASPQKGNSQDVALLYRMKEKGLAPKTQGGGVEIFHLSGGEQITAFLKKQIDAIWAVEPWLTRLVLEARGKILFEEGELWPEGRYATTVLAARKKFLDEHRDLVQKWIAAHVEIVEWIHGHDGQAKELFNQEFEREVGQSLPADYLDQFFARIRFTPDPMQSQVLESAHRAQAIGYLGKAPVEFSNLYDLSFLDED